MQCCTTESDMLSLKRRQYYGRNVPRVQLDFRYGDSDLEVLT
jgi:hypothetical protein